MELFILIEMFRNLGLGLIHWHLQSENELVEVDTGYLNENRIFLIILVSLSRFKALHQKVRPLFVDSSILGVEVADRHLLLDVFYILLSAEEGVAVKLIITTHYQTEIVELVIVFVIELSLDQEVIDRDSLGLDTSLDLPLDLSVSGEMNSNIIVVVICVHNEKVRPE